jgi:hypothetical protein
LAAKCLAKKHTQAIKNILGDKQLGFAVKGGAEAAIHSLRAYTECEQNAKKLVIKLDFKNAFNTMKRDYLLRRVKSLIPQLYPSTYQALRRPSLLLYENKHVILSETGVQQGDPMGGALFCIGEKELVDSMRSEVNLWYYDDGTIADKPDIVLEDVGKVLAFTSTSGLELNFAKCEAFCPDGIDMDLRTEIESLLPGVKYPDKQSFELLGSPIFEEAIPTYIRKKRAVTELMCDRLTKIDAQPALFLLRNCVGAPRSTYLLRTSPAYKENVILQETDDTITAAVERILNVKLDHEQQLQAKLPLRWGGLAVRNLKDIALPCYLSSVNECRAMVAVLAPNGSERHDSICSTTAANFINLINYTEELQADVLISQSKLDDIVCATMYNELFEATDKVEQSRLMAAADSASSKWLQAIPSDKLGTKLTNSATRLGVAIRLGATTNQSHQCVCGAEVDVKGRHGLSCSKSAGRHLRHACINDLVSRALTSAGVPNIKEVVGLSLTDARRPDGMTLIPFKEGRSMVWDATVSDLFASSKTKATPTNPGETANNAELRKMNKYLDLATSYTVQPIAFDTMGVPGRDTRAFLKDMGKRLRKATGELRSGEFLAQRISIEITRANAVSILGTFKDVCDSWKELELIN